MHSHITAKSVKLASTSEWANIIRCIRAMNSSDKSYQAKAEPILRQFVAQIQRDEVALKSENFAAISDAAIHAPRASTSLNNGPFRVAYFCAQVMFQETGRIPVELHAKIHWQRLISKLSRAYMDHAEKQATIAAEFKVNRLLEHQRKNWCELISSGR